MAFPIPRLQLAVVPLQVSGNGTTLRNEILGTVQLRVLLTGMPELRLGLNDKILFESTGREFQPGFLRRVCTLEFSVEKRVRVLLCCDVMRDPSGLLQPHTHTHTHTHLGQVVCHTHLDREPPNPELLSLAVQIRER